MHNRGEHILKKKNFVMKINLRIASIFQCSQNVSVEKGKSHKLSRKALLKDEKETKEREVKQVKDKVNSIPSLIAEIRYKTEKIEEYEKDQSILSKLYDMGSLTTMEI